MKTNMTRQARGEQGLGLIELMIYAAFSLVVLGMVGSIFIVMLTTQQNVLTTNSSAASAQLVATTIETGIRNSTAFALTTEPSGNQFLVARSAGSGANPSWQCIAWYYSVDGSLRYHRSDSAITAPSSGELSSWTLLGTGLVPTQGTTIFSGSQAVLNLDFQARNPGTPTVTIATSVSPQAGPVESAPCF